MPLGVGSRVDELGRGGSLSRETNHGGVTRYPLVRTFSVSFINGFDSLIGILLLVNPRPRHQLASGHTVNGICWGSLEAVLGEEALFAIEILRTVGIAGEAEAPSGAVPRQLNGWPHGKDAVLLEKLDKSADVVMGVIGRRQPERVTSQRAHRRRG